MKIKSTAMLVASLSIGLFCWCAFAGGETLLVDGDGRVSDYERLTVDQSIGAIFVRRPRGELQVPVELQSHLKSMLTDPVLAEYHEKVVLRFSFIGNKDDLSYLRRLIERFKRRPISGDEMRLMRRALRAIANMGVRRVAGAVGYLRSCCAKSYWKELARPEWQDEFAVLSVHCYAVTRPVDIEAVARSLSSHVSKDNPTGLMSYQDKLSPKYLGRLVKQWTPRVFPSLSSEARKEYSKRYNGDVNRPRPAEYSMWETDGEFSDDLDHWMAHRRASVSAFFMCWDALMSNDFDQKQAQKSFVSLVKPSDTPDDFSERVNRLRKRLQSLQHCGGASWKLLSTEVANDNKPRTLTVKWQLTCKKGATDNPNPRSADSLVLVMRRISGKWHWDSTGW